MSLNAPKIKENEYEKAQENEKCLSLRSDVRVALVWAEIKNILRSDLLCVSYLNPTNYCGRKCGLLHNNMKKSQNLVMVTSSMRLSSNRLYVKINQNAYNIIIKSTYKAILRRRR